MLSDQHWIVRLIYHFGPVTAGLAFLIWWLTATVEKDLATILANQHQGLTTLSTTKVDYGYTIMQLERVEVLLQQICANGAETSLERSACFQR